MPEGDSIHRLARRLTPKLAGKTIIGTELRIGDQQSLDGLSFIEVQAVGKHILMRLERGDQKVTIHSHLRMQGEWTVISPGKQLPQKVEEELRVRLFLDDGSTLCALRLPVLDILDTRQESEVVGYLGPDLLDRDADLAVAVERLAVNPEVPAVSAILDQRNVCGIGNLWAIEVLFLRGVYPWRPIGEVDTLPLLKLAQRMMRFSLDVVPGMVTTGSKRKGETHWVYGRYKKPCNRCRTPIDFREGGTGPYDRETWWCPHCQPA